MGESKGYSRLPTSSRIVEKWCRGILKWSTMLTSSKGDSLSYMSGSDHKRLLRDSECSKEFVMRL